MTSVTTRVFRVRVQPISAQRVVSTITRSSMRTNAFPNAMKVSSVASPRISAKSAPHPAQHAKIRSPRALSATKIPICHFCTVNHAGNLALPTSLY